MWILRKNETGNDDPAAAGAGNVPNTSRPTHPTRAKPLHHVWVWAERSLFVMSLLLLAFYVFARVEQKLASREALKRFAAIHARVTRPIPAPAREEAVAPEEPKALQLEVPSETEFKDWDASRVNGYKASAAGETDLAIGILRIPKIGLVAPLFDGADDQTLNRGLGRIRGTARIGESGNVGIAGHRDSFFRGLKDVGEGDAIELDGLRGTDTYIVGEIQIVEPGDVSVLEPRAARSLTLVTCYPFYYVGSAPKRYVVTAFLSEERKSGAEYSVTPPAISNLQDKQEEQ